MDELLGLKLLIQFVNQRHASAVQAAESSIDSADQTAHSFVTSLHGGIASGILAAVFDPANWNASITIPRRVLVHWTKAAPSLGVPLSIRAFGDFHQLCLSRPLYRLSTDAPVPKHGQTRRARGIHYTPPPVVDYLTRRLLDRLVSQRSDRDLLGIRILDPSCGSGAFLIAAAKYLFQIMEQRLRARSSPQYRLDFVRNSILGIDIDSQAVKWTRRSLLLTVWESGNESQDRSIDEPLRVPALDGSIRCADFLGADFEPVDAIIGGPPFVRLQELRKAIPEKLADYSARFTTARAGQFDLYMLFFEQAVLALRLARVELLEHFHTIRQWPSRP